MKGRVDYTVLDGDIRLVEELIERIKTSDFDHINGMELARAVELVYKCGLQLEQVTSLRVTDVDLDHAGNPVRIRLGEGKVVGIPADARNSIKDYLAHRSPSATSDMLLPGYEYTKKLKRHLEVFCKRPDFRKIRKIGMKRMFRTLIQGGCDEDESLRRVANQFGTTVRSAEQSLTNTIQPAGSVLRGIREEDLLTRLFDRIPFTRTLEDADALELEVNNFIANSRFKNEEKRELADIFLQQMDERRQVIRTEPAAVEDDLSQPMMSIDEMMRSWSDEDEPEDEQND